MIRVIRYWLIAMGTRGSSPSSSLLCNGCPMTHHWLCPYWIFNSRFSPMISYTAPSISSRKWVFFTYLWADPCSPQYSPSQYQPPSSQSTPWVFIKAGVGLHNHDQICLNIAVPNLTPSQSSWRTYWIGGVFPSSLVIFHGLWLAFQCYQKI